ncbi:MAG: TetR/AcrR family transcriptional regulator [Bacteroidia bacterium]|nr:TetR/AcrR family transcriptional regulator [Bacteroidia bacterium]
MSPKSPAQNEVIRQQSRSKILEAALELFASRGFHNTSIEQIRKLAGVSKGLIYNYFADKEDLMNQIVFEEMKQGDVIIEKMGRLTNSKDRFKFLIDFSFDYFRTQKHHSKLMVSLAMQMEDFPKLKDIILARYKGTLPLMTMLLEDLGAEDPKEEAITISAALDGIGMQYLVLGEELPLDDLKEHLIKKYCK